MTPAADQSSHVRRHAGAVAGPVRSGQAATAATTGASRTGAAPARPRTRRRAPGHRQRLARRRRHDGRDGATAGSARGPHTQWRRSPPGPAGRERRRRPLLVRRPPARAVQLERRQARVCDVVLRCAPALARARHVDRSERRPAHHRSDVQAAPRCGHHRHRAGPARTTASQLAGFRAREPAHEWRAHLGASAPRAPAPVRRTIVGPIASTACRRATTWSASSARRSRPRRG